MLQKQSAALATADTISATDITSTPAPVAKAVDTIARTEKPIDVKKVSEVTGEEGVHLSYVEGTGKTKDTINVIIPSSSTGPVPSATLPSVASSGTPATGNTEAPNQAGAGTSTAAGKDDLKFLDLKMDAKKIRLKLPK